MLINSLFAKASNSPHNKRVTCRLMSITTTNVLFFGECNALVNTQLLFFIIALPTHQSSLRFHEFHCTIIVFINSCSLSLNVTLLHHSRTMRNNSHCLWIHKSVAITSTITPIVQPFYVHLIRFCDAALHWKIRFYKVSSSDWVHVWVRVRTSEWGYLCKQCIRSKNKPMVLKLKLGKSVRIRALVV